MHLAKATVTRELAATPDLQILEVYHNGKLQQAYNYLTLNRALSPNEHILINTIALDLGLGTGGAHFVVPDNNIRPDLSDDPAAPNAVDVSDVPSTPDAPNAPKAPKAPNAHAGHIIKLRYTPLQHNVLAVEEPVSPHHETLREASSVAGMPVVCCALHSQMPLVAAAIRARLTQAQIAYCMTDEAALPLAYSHITRKARETQLINCTISCGQAFGGELEAVTLYSGLLAAHHVAKCDIAIVAPGPGTVGTNTRFGHTGTAQGVALNAADALDGVPICALRVSFADKRPRHQGISHHSQTALAQICLTEALIPLPDQNSLPEAELLQLLQQIQEIQEIHQSRTNRKHYIQHLPVNPAEINLRGLKVSTMGRSQADDPAFFITSYAAGILAAKLSAQRQINPSAALKQPPLEPIDLLTAQHQEPVCDPTSLLT
jgi:hypothetical protein